MGEDVQAGRAGERAGGAAGTRVCTGAVRGWGAVGALHACAQTAVGGQAQAAPEQHTLAGLSALASVCTYRSANGCWLQLRLRERAMQGWSLPGREKGSGAPSYLGGGQDALGVQEDVPGHVLAAGRGGEGACGSSGRTTTLLSTIDCPFKLRPSS